MKITFEGETMNDIVVQMAQMLAGAPGNALTQSPPEPITRQRVEPTKAQGPGPDPFSVKTPVDKPVEKPGRTAKQLENDERLRTRAAEKAAAKKAAKAPAPEPAPAPPPKSAEGMDPAEVVKVRQKTIEDLQSAYANGFQKEVFELLSKYGNGAKSFRELPPDAFVPIRQAIDDGAFAS